MKGFEQVRLWRLKARKRLRWSGTLQGPDMCFLTQLHRPVLGGPSHCLFEFVDSS